MDKLVIEGGVSLEGQVTISGAKNAALPLMAASLLANGKHTFANVPRLRDIHTMQVLLSNMGAVSEHGDLFELDTSNLRTFEAPYELVKTMRASVLVLGPLVARHRQARVSLPGGCAIGARPINLHLKGLQQMGVDIELAHGYVIARAPTVARGGDQLRAGDRHRDREPHDGRNPGRRGNRAAECGPGTGSGCSRRSI